MFEIKAVPIYILIIASFFYIWYTSLKQKLDDIEKADIPTVDVQIAWQIGTLILVVFAVLVILFLVNYGLQFLHILRPGEGTINSSFTIKQVFTFDGFFVEVIAILAALKACITLNDFYNKAMLDKDLETDKEYVKTQVIAIYVVNLFIFIVFFIMAHLYQMY